MLPNVKKQAFLEVLHTYQREQQGIQSVLRRVAELFRSVKMSMGLATFLFQSRASQGPR
jgi:histone deacetylase complex regulatory component SIN3